MDLAVGAVAIADGIVDVFQQLDVPAGQFAPRYLRINGEELGLLHRLTGARLPIDDSQRRRIFLHAEVIQLDGDRQLHDAPVTIRATPLHLAFRHTHQEALHVRRTESRGKEQQPESGMVEVEGIVRPSEVEQPTDEECTERKQRKEVEEHKRPSTRHSVETEAGGKVHRSLGRPSSRLRRESHDDTRHYEGDDERHSQRHTRVPTADSAAFRAPRDGGG